MNRAPRRPPQARTPRWFGRLVTAAGIARLLSWYVAFGLLKRAVPLRALARWAWCDPRGERDPLNEATIVARLVRMRRLLSTADRDCLQRSLLLYRELSRAGADPVLVVGFRSASSGLQGHAWVLVDGQAVLDPLPDGDRFVSACSFGRDGRVIPTPMAGASA